MRYASMNHWRARFNTCKNAGPRALDFCGWEINPSRLAPVPAPHHPIPLEAQRPNQMDLRYQQPNQELQLQLSTLVLRNPKN